MVAILAITRRYPREPRAGLRLIFVSFVRSVPVLFAPVIIIGGIMGGVFTATEAAVVACVYALLIGAFAYRTLSLKGFIAEVRASFEMTATMMVMLGGAMLFGWLLVRQGAASRFAEWAISFAGSPEQLLIVVNLALLVCGMFLDPVVIILVATPILLPALDTFQIDRVQFGVILVINVMVGMMTPPIGMLAFVMAKVGNMDLLTTFRALGPFMVPVLIVLALVTLFPALSLWLPGIVFGAD
jgi:tripartite ATP-independent transporter DctM subunit